MGLEPISWGPHVWAAIHIICLGAPEMFQGGDHLSYFKFFDSLPYVLPCEKCREHLKRHMEKYPIDAALAGGRSTLFTWSVNLHNAVNRSIGKPEMSVPDAMKHWTTVLNGTNKDGNRSTQSHNEGCHNMHQTFKKILMVLMFIIMGMILGIIIADSYLKR